jgi:hypothetical protein
VDRPRTRLSSDPDLSFSSRLEPGSCAYGMLHDGVSACSVGQWLMAGAELF